MNNKKRKLPAASDALDAQASRPDPMPERIVASDRAYAEYFATRDPREQALMLQP